MGKNQPLRKEHPKWKSDVPLTEGQLRSKRDEFWDTAPVFEGKCVCIKKKKTKKTLINSLASARIQGFLEKKTPKRTWLCTGISPVWYALQTR